MLDTKVAEFMDKVKKLEKNEKLDLSSDEDLSIAVMNLISIEEHLFFTASKTGKSGYLDLLDQVRQMRKDLLKKLIKDYEGEVWCTSKHLLASSMRLMEVGTKMLGKGDKNGAQEMFNKSFQLYSLFWGINLKVIKLDKAKNKQVDKLHFIDESVTPVLQASENIFERMGQIVKKAIDCCRE